MEVIRRFRFFIIFGFVGVLCVLIDYGFYLVFIDLVKIAFLAKVMSSIISVSVNYVLNSKFNFSNKQKINAKFYMGYLMLYALLILLNALINSLFIKLTGDIKHSFWLAALIAAFVNYFSVKIYFKRINALAKLS